MTYYTATSIIPPYCSTILYHPVNFAYYPMCPQATPSSLFPTTARTSYTFATLVRAYVTLALLYCTKQTILPDDYAFLCATQ